jgi:cysteinyl-tRNA synthetase
MSLTLYNTLTRRKEPFVPIDPKNVRMYVCGPTVYDTPHIGNARAVVVFDQLYRLLRHEFGEGHVKYVRNITDIDDKIIEAARAGGEPISALTERTTAVFHQDMAALGALPPDVEPRCTAHVPQMIAMIERLIAGGHAYAAEGHVLFAVASWQRYGRLSRRSRQEMVAGARIEVAPYKKDPGDFVLWKPSSPEQPGWESPWGRGRPGWHIECSAMSEAHLGEHFDIHGGGLDLIFPHHENEIAQSEAAHDGRKFSVDSTKMSKSLGNFVTVHELLQSGVPGEVIRLALLSTHYRDPLDWTEERLRQAKQTLDGWYRALATAVHGDVKPPLVSKLVSPVIEALKDDLNVWLAITRMHAFVRHFEWFDHPHSQIVGDYASRQQALRASMALIGLADRATSPLLRGSYEQGSEIQMRIAERSLARKERRFADADRIRAELAAEGIVLEDKPDGTTDWRRG